MFGNNIDYVVAKHIPVVVKRIPGNTRGSVFLESCTCFGNKIDTLRYMFDNFYMALLQKGPVICEGIYLVSKTCT